jgi:hypothetical protein
VKLTRRLRELAIGHTVNWLSAYPFDYVLYPFVLWKLGLAYGSALMAIVSLLSCLGTLWFYDWSKRDWLGIEAAKQLRDGAAGSSRFRRVLAWALKKGDWATCLLLSLKFDPFITTAWMRRGAYCGMARRDWNILFLSWFISNAYWTLVCFGGVELARKLWVTLSSTSG